MPWRNQHNVPTVHLSTVRKIKTNIWSIISLCKVHYMSLTSTHANVFIPGNPCKSWNKTFTFFFFFCSRNKKAQPILVEKYLKAFSDSQELTLYDYPLKSRYLGTILKFLKTVQSLFTFLPHRFHKLHSDFLIKTEQPSVGWACHCT